MGCTACTEPQCLYKGDLYLYLSTPVYCSKYVNEISYFPRCQLYTKKLYGFMKKKPKHVAVVVIYLSFSCIYVIKIVLDCTIIYIYILLQCLYATGGKAVVEVAIVRNRCCLLVCTGVHLIYKVMCYRCVPVCIVFTRCCVLVCSGVHPICKMLCYWCVPLCIVFTRCCVIGVFLCASYL